MKIYTKSGDKGKTSLLGGKRVSKDDIRIEAYGTVDELNSILGVCRSMNPPDEINESLEILQKHLFILGADLASPQGKSIKSSKRISSEHVQFIEQQIDKIESYLPPLKNFIIPGGHPLAGTLHIARSVCRRAERRVVHLSHQRKVNKVTIQYLNRLSDLLFVFARWVNVLNKIPERKWWAE